MTNEAEDQSEQPFSDELASWLHGDAPKSLGSMAEAFGEKSFAVVIMLLLFPSALPLPTGGITDIFAVVAALLAVEMILGAKSIWLPKRLRNREVSQSITGRAIPFIVKRIKWFEKRSRPRLRVGFRSGGSRANSRRVVADVRGGHDHRATVLRPRHLARVGGVAIALSIILEDIVVLGIGTLIGTGGIVLIVTLGVAACLFKSIF